MALMGNQFPITRKQPAYIRFENKTCFYVEVIWISYDNKEKLFGTLAPNKFLDVNTYSTHPWIFKECISKSQMVVCGKEIFIARPWIEEYRRLEFKHPINIPLRTIVLIEMPVLNLRQICLLNLASTFETEDEVIMLEIPMILKKELAQMISNKETIKI